MKTKAFIILLLLPLFACEEYLDREGDVESITERDVFSTYNNIRRHAEYMYDMMYNPNATALVRSPKHYSHPMLFSDEMLPSSSRIAYDDANMGNYMSYVVRGIGGGTYEFTEPYERGWQGIRVANVTIQNIDQPSDITPEQKQLLLGQCYFVRAMCYFQILKRYGGMPYFRKALQLGEYLGYDRDSYYETAKNIAGDCDLAFENLPISWDDDNTGRPIKAAALALKSRVLLYAASETYNDNENVQQKWEEAALAANDFIEYIENGDPYHTLIDASDAINIRVSAVSDSDYYAGSAESLKAYREIFINPPMLNEEILFSYSRRQTEVWGTTVPGRLFILSKYGYKASAFGICPTQDVVDWYETQNGLSTNDDPAFDEQNPYVNRDPRFYNNILFDGVTWPDGLGRQSIELHSTGEDGTPGLDRQPVGGDPVTGMSITGYAARKYWPEGYTGVMPDAKQTPSHIPIVWFRVAEAYLNYAEAAYEASGRSDVNAKFPSSAKYSALTAVNVIRNRVGMPDVHPDYQKNPDFIDRVRNERSVEFCFEDEHRWFDIRRWYIAHEEEIRTVEVTDIDWIGITSEYPTGYRFTRRNHPQVKVFLERQYLYPLSRDEVAIHDEFDQNPGW